MLVLFSISPSPLPGRFLCAYLAFKVDEYNVSVDNFVHVLHEELREHVAEFVLTHELLLLRKLKFHLTIHCPFRPVEGFIIDMKVGLPGLWLVGLPHDLHAISLRLELQIFPTPISSGGLQTSFW